MPKPRLLPAAVFLSLLWPVMLLTSCTSSTNTVASTVTNTKIWVVSWGNSPENASATSENAGGSEQSYRFFFYPTVSGTTERVRFSNYYGTSPITIGAARLAVAATVPAIDPSNDSALTFGGSSSVTLAAGQTVVSDPVTVTYSFGQKLAVSMYLKGTYGPLTQHDSQAIINYATPANAGNTTGDSSGASYTTQNTEWYLLSGVDVYGDYQGTVALFGSSAIDGHNSNFGNTNSYPTANVVVAGQDNDRPSDWLARELNAAGYNIGVLNAGTLGDPAGPVPGLATATPGVERMTNDVLSQPSIKAVIIYFGSIDLRNGCENASDVEPYLTSMVSQANAVGVRVILGTLPPATYCLNSGTPNSGLVPTASDPFAGDINPGPENPDSTQRNILNAWIKTTGAQLPGVYGVADFSAVLSDPAHPDFMIPNLNSGDNFHPNGVGYGVQSSAIPLGSLLAQ